MTIRVQPLSAPMPGDHGDGGDELPGPGLVGEDRLEGVHERRAGVDQGVVGDQAHHRRGDQHVEDGAERGAEQRGPADVDPGVLHPLGRHRRRLDADEGEERHTGGDADGAVQAAAGGVERPEVPALDEEPADDADEQQGHELEHDGDVLEPRHLPDPDQVDHGRHPQPDHGDAPVLHAADVRPAEQGVDVEHPGGDDGGVAGPGLDPVAPADQIAGEVTELVPGVGVEAAVTVGDPPGQLAEQHGQEHGAHGDDAEHDDAHGAGAGQHGRHGEHPGTDDAADDQPGGRGQPQGMGLFLVAPGQPLAGWRGLNRALPAAPPAVDR